MIKAGYRDECEGHTGQEVGIIVMDLCPLQVGILTFRSPCPMALKMYPSVALTGSASISQKLRNFFLSGEKWLLVLQSMMIPVEGDTAGATWLCPEVTMRAMFLASL